MSNHSLESPTSNTWYPMDIKCDGSHLQFSHYCLCVLVFIHLLIVLFVSVVFSQSDITLTREEDLNQGLNLVSYPVFRSLTHPVCGIIRVIALGISLHLTKDGLSVWYMFISLLWLSRCHPIMTVSCFIRTIKHWLFPIPIHPTVFWFRKLKLDCHQ